IRVESVDALPPDVGLLFYTKLVLNLISPYPYSVTKHYTPRFRAKLHSLMEGSRFDVIHCEWTPYARYVLLRTQLPILIAAHNIEWLIWKRRADHSENALAKLFFALQAAKMKRFERHALSTVTAVTLVSNTDAAQAKAWGARNAQVVENG